MKIIQLPSIPIDGIWKGDGLCFGIQNEKRNTNYLFRRHVYSHQNYGAGWFCSKNPIQFTITFIKGK